MASAEDRTHATIRQKLGVMFESVHLDGRTLRRAQERVNVATKLVALLLDRNQRQANDAWFQSMSEATGLDLDEDLLEGQEAPSKKEIVRAEAQLKALLREPLQKQRFGKFLSTHRNAPDRVR